MAKKYAKTDDEVVAKAEALRAAFVCECGGPAADLFVPAEDFVHRKWMPLVPMRERREEAGRPDPNSPGTPRYVVELFRWRCPCGNTAVAAVENEVVPE